MKPATRPTIDVFPLNEAEDLQLPCDQQEIEARIEALERSVTTHGERLDEELHVRIDRLEQLLNMQIIATRKDLAHETNERREHFARLAGKVSKYLDKLERRTVSLEVSQAHSHLETDLADEINAARKNAQETAEQLRALIDAARCHMASPTREPATT